MLEINGKAKWMSKKREFSARPGSEAKRGREVVNPYKIQHHSFYL